MRSTASEEEAMAAIAAIQRFIAETAARGGEEPERMSPWQRAALIEGVSAKGTVADPEGDNPWLS